MGSRVALFFYQLTFLYAFHPYNMFSLVGHLHVQSKTAKYNKQFISSPNFILLTGEKQKWRKNIL